MLDLTKQFLRIDGNFEDDLINSLVLSAKTYLHNATGKQFDKENKTHEMIVLLLVTRWYENRNLIGSDDLDYTLKSLILQADLEPTESDSNV